MNHPGLALQNLDLSSNALGRSFCEAFSELLKSNHSLKKIDISCNMIDESAPAMLSTLKDAVRGNPRIVELDVRNNQLTEETEDEIKEVVAKHKLQSLK